MDIFPTAGLAPSMNQVGSPTGDAQTAISNDFETFLKMMTVQARYQDPLDPMDSSEYASQLAQFSMVEQQVLTNDLLDALSGALGIANMASLSGWIGMEALSPADVAFAGQPVTVAPSPLAAADELFLVVYDEDGTEVQRTSIPVTTDDYEWDGLGDDGQPLPEGTYSLRLENYAEGELLLEESAMSYSKITEARLEAGQTVLILDGGAAVLSSSIGGLREGS